MKFLSLQSFSIINYTKFAGHALSLPLGWFYWKVYESNRLVTIMVLWKCEVNRSRIVKVIAERTKWYRKKEKKNNREEKTKRKQKGFRLKSETLNNNRKEKTERKQKGYRLKSETLIIEKKRQNENRKVSD